MENIRPSGLTELCAGLEAEGNDEPLRLRLGRDAEGTPWKAEVLAGGTPLFDLPLEVEPPIPADTPASAPCLAAEEVKSNVLGWLNMAAKEAARLNVPGRESMADLAVREIEKAKAAIRRYVC